MATIVNSPSPDNSGNTVGMIFALLFLAGLAYLFFIYGLPTLRGGTSTGNSNKTDINIIQPTGTEPTDSDFFGTSTAAPSPTSVSVLTTPTTVVSSPTSTAP